MDWSQLKLFLGFFSGFIGPVIFFTVIAIWRKKLWIGRLRMVSIGAQLIHGGAAVHLYRILRDRFGDFEFAPHARELVVSTAIKGVVGLVFVAWSFLVAVIVRKRKKKTENPSRLYFYLFCVDMAMIACFAVSVSYGTTSLPGKLTECDNLPRGPTRLFSRIGRVLGEDYSESCRRVLTTQMMTIILMVAMILQSILLVPLLTLPTGLRATVFFVVRLLRLMVLLDGKRIRLRDSEMGPDMEEDEKKSLASVFRNSNVAANIASHLHYSDVVNVSLSSKKIRNAVLVGSENNGHSERVELLAESSCEGRKSECWGCARVICSSCKVTIEDVKSTRTGQHMTGCHAICTGCYLLRVTVEPAPPLATLHPSNLSVQHREHSGATLQSQAVDVCLHCSSLTPAEISALREDRERLALQTSLKRRIYCAKCEKALPKESMRWWICSTGNHECHWKGHDVLMKRR